MIPENQCWRRRIAPSAGMVTMTDATMVPLSNERDMTTDEFNEWFRRLGLPEKELARRLDTSQSTINRWTTGQRKPPPYLWRALEHLEQELEKEQASRRPAAQEPAG